VKEIKICGFPAIPFEKSFFNSRLNKSINLSDCVLIWVEINVEELPLLTINYQDKINLGLLILKSGYDSPINSTVTT
jgi:hypothetical protein